MRKLIIGAGIGLAAALLAAALGALPFVDIVELKTYDWRMRATADPDSARDDIVLVTIDEESLRGLEPLVGRWPWPRLVHAQLLHYLARAQPRVVLYDVLFTEHDRRKFFVQDEEWTGADSDNELSAAARKLPVIFPGDAVPEALEGGAPPVPLPADLPLLAVPADVRAETRPVFVPPIAEIARSARVVTHNFAALDADGPWRRYVPFIRYQDHVIPSLAVAAAAVAAGTDTVHTPATPRTLIPFRGRRSDGTSPYRQLSFYKLFYAEQQLLAGQTPLEAPDRLRGKIVVVGATAPALDDVFTVPVAGKAGGLEVHATVVDSILSRRTLTPASRGASFAFTLATAMLLGLAGAIVGPWITIGVALALWAAITGFTTWQFAAGVWYPLVVPLIALTLATFGDIAFEYFVEGREKRRVKRLFSRFVSKDVYQQLMSDPAGARLGGQRRRMTVLFSDIRGFTTVSERGQPEAIVAQLNEYFSRMVPDRARPPRHRGQVRRRHDHGTLRRPARRRGPRGSRRRDGTRDVGEPRPAEP